MSNPGSEPEHPDPEQPDPEQLGSRQEVLAALGAAGRAQSTAMVLFHANVAARLGLGATEVKVLELVARFSVLSPKELCEHTGLAPASITGILDRLEAKRFVERRASRRDRRSVEVVHSPRHTEVVRELFTPFVAGLADLHERYSDDELRLLLDYTRAVTRVQEDAAVDLAAPSPDASGPERRGGRARPT